MTSPQLIPTNVKVPNDFKHRWVFVAGPFRSEIRGMQGREELRLEEYRIGPKPDWVDIDDLRNDYMDWMQEAVEHLKYLCEPEEID